MAININSNYHTTIKIQVNKTNIPFITCDTPIFREPLSNNQYTDSFYFPINPKIAIHLIVTQKFYNIFEENPDNHKKIIEDETIIKNLNKKLANNCINEIYANDKKILEELQAIL